MSAIRSKNKVSIVYASALFDAYKKEPFIEFGYVVKLMEANDKELYQSMVSPVIPASSKKEILTAVLRNSIKDYMLEYLFILIDKKRINLVFDIYLAYTDILNQSDGVVCGEINIPIYASQDDEDNVSKIISKILNSKVSISFVRDKAVIAGFNGMAGGSFIDYSAIGHLKQLENELK